MNFEKGSIEDDFDDNQISTNLKKGFIRKVYSIVLVQLLLTFLISLIPMYNPSFKKFQKENSWLMIVNMVIYILSAIFLFCYQKVARRVPLNYIVLFIFTFSVAYMVSFACASAKNHNIVITAALMTFGVTLGLTIYAFTTKHDFTVWGGAIVIMSFTLISMSLSFLIFGKPGKTLHIIFLVVGIIFYGIFLIYDTQLIAGGGRYELDIDDYVIAACMIYLDIVVLFLKILELLGAASD